MTLLRVIDFETTGTPSDTTPAGIVEYGFHDVQIGDDGQASLIPGSAMWGFVNPGIPCGMEARAVHHITDKEIENGISPFGALRIIEGGKPDFYVAHNAAFEQSFFPVAPAPWICTYKVALRKWPAAPKHSNQFLRYFLDLPVNPSLCQPPHRALPDAYVTAHLLVKILSFKPDLAILTAISAEPPRPWIIGFGKHKGTAWCDLPSDYLDWIARKSDMDADTKWLANHWISKNQTEAAS